MVKRLIGFFIYFTVVSLSSADYYMVEPTGETYPVVKTPRGYERISSEQSFFLNFAPGYIDTIWYFDPDIAGWYYPNRDSNSVVIQLFQYQYACSLVAVGINYYSPKWAEFYVWEGPDSIPNSTDELQTQINANWNYDTVVHSWISWPTVLYGPDSIGSDAPDDGQVRTCWVDLEPDLDIDTSAVWVGYRIITRYNPDGIPYGGKPWSLSDGWVTPEGNGPRFIPCRSWFFMDHPYYGYITWRPYGDITGDWEIKYVINVYENVPPLMISFDKLPGTYDTGDKVVTANIEDIGAPPESSGVAEAWLLYYLNDNPGTLDSVEMFLVDGTIANGKWEATIPGQSPETKVTYYFSATDLQGSNRDNEEEAHFYYVGKGTPDNILLLLEDDAYYGVPYSHDPVSASAPGVDLWDESSYGIADSSVFYYYHSSGPGQPIIFWFTWGGARFKEETDFLSNFLDTGGRLFLSSQDLPAGYWPCGIWEAPPGSFIHDYMKAYAGDDDYNSDETFIQHGVSWDIITGAANLSEITVYPYYWAGPGYNWAGRFDELDPACVPIFYGEFGAVMGYRYADTTIGYKIVWIYWPINYIILISGVIEDDIQAQDTLIARTLRWFGYETDIEEKGFSRGRFFISQATPNPFMDRTLVQYELTESSNIHAVIYNLLGQEVKELVAENQIEGLHTVTWDGRDNSDRKVPNGPYFLRFTIKPRASGEANTGDRKAYIATRKLSVMN